MSSTDELKEAERKLKEKLVELRAMYRQGKATLADALPIDKEELEQMYAFGLQCLKVEKDQQAATVLSTLAMLNPYDVRHWRVLGLALQKIERPSLALASFEMALCIEPVDVPTLTYRGETYILLGRKVEARRDLQAVIELKPESAELQPFVTRARGLLPYTQVTA